MVGPATLFVSLLLLFFFPIGDFQQISLTYKNQLMTNMLHPSQMSSSAYTLTTLHTMTSSIKDQMCLILLLTKRTIHSTNIFNDHKNIKPTRSILTIIPDVLYCSMGRILKKRTFERFTNKEDLVPQKYKMDPTGQQKHINAQTAENNVTHYSLCPEFENKQPSQGTKLVR